MKHSQATLRAGMAMLPRIAQHTQRHRNQTKMSQSEAATRYGPGRSGCRGWNCRLHGKKAHGWCLSWTNTACSHYTHTNARSDDVATKSCFASSFLFVFFIVPSAKWYEYMQERVCASQHSRQCIYDRGDESAHSCACIKCVCGKAGFLYER